MPVHEVPRGQLALELRRIARTEHVVTVTQDGDMFVIVTEPGAPIETRLGAATHQARVGIAWDREPLLHSFITDHIVIDEVNQ
jgi:hypothetical protein